VQTPGADLRNYGWREIRISRQQIKSSTGMLMETAKGFLADFINKKLKLQKLAVQKGDTWEPADSLATARYKAALLCLMKNSRQDLKEIIKLSPPHMSERQATEEFLKNVSMAADEFADEFAKSIEALSRIVLWKDNKCLDKFPDDFIPELDSAIKEIFPDSGLWGNIAWDAIVKNAEKFLSTNYNDIITLSIYSRAVTILVSLENRIAKLFFESFRTDVIKAIVINIIQPMAHSLGDEIPMDDNNRKILLEKLSLLQTSLLAA
jgi:hypothetical protein